ncbi:mobilization protein MbpA [Tenacibaculum dicentrarchi]|uniref:mobilization protein MbpA n=1 Tax=Tenacibaculum dicentrarchi TaxID=669041 RepID=UPI003519327F
MKNQKIEFRCTLFEKKLLKVKAKKAGLSLSEFCRKSANDKMIIERLTEEQISIYKMLITYHNNFKSIGNLIKNKHPDLYQKVFQTADEIKNHLKIFK